MQHICVFCGSTFGAQPIYKDAARATGQTLAERGLTLVYGGSRVGLMGTVADAVIAGGGRAVGVIPRHLADKRVAHEGLAELHIVDTMHARKQLMADLADAFIALPGGLGTLEELFEVLTWAQLGLHRKPVSVLNVAGFYDPLLAMIDHAVTQQFMGEDHRRLIVEGPTAPELLDTLATYTPPVVDKYRDLKLP